MSLIRSVRHVANFYQICGLTHFWTSGREPKIVPYSIHGQRATARAALFSAWRAAQRGRPSAKEGRWSIAPAPAVVVAPPSGARQAARPARHFLAARAGT